MVNPYMRYNVVTAETTANPQSERSRFSNKAKWISQAISTRYTMQGDNSFLIEQRREHRTPKMSWHLNSPTAFYCLSVLMIFGCVYTIYTVDNKILSFHTLQAGIQSESKEMPVIRSWNVFFSESLVDILSTSFEATNCEYKCRFVDRNNVKYTNTDAYIFHSRNLNSNDLPTSRTRDQLYILFGMESAYHFGDSYLKLPPNYFNATSTYSMDSDYPFPYFSYSRRKKDEKPMWNQSEITSKFKNKSGIAVINSNCDTESKREKYMSELSKHINITKKGECYKSFIKNCPRYGSVECRNKFLSQFKFYLAFENSVCQDYVTEKFSYQTQMLIPIVLKRSVVERIVPKNEKMFIAADDFDSPEKLAKYLRFLENNDDEYLKYFDWVKRYRLRPNFGANSMCKLCEDLHTRKERVVKDAKKFIVDEANCQDNYAEKLISRRYLHL